MAYKCILPIQAALALVKRFVEDGVEANGQRSRDRLKIIPRVVNVEVGNYKGVGRASYLAGWF